MEPTLIADYACDTGEGVLWHPLEHCVYWLDIPPGRLFRYDPATGTHQQVLDAGEAIGGYTFQADGALLLFMARGAVKRWQNNTLSTVIEDIPAERDSRFNDVIADPAGRVFCGTMPGQQLGRLYRLDQDRTLTMLLDGLATSNGMGFTPDRTAMYHTVTGERRIYLFDYEQESGALSNRRVFVQLGDDQRGWPDGLTVDAEGFVWSARWSGGCLVRYAPDGSEERRITFPANDVSCVAFGGADYTDIYVTTAGGTNKAANGPGAGALFQINVGIAGVPEFFSRVEA